MISARAGRRTRLLEIGTSNGYSTIWLAHAARSSGGRVTSVERDPRKRSTADENLRRAGLRDVVDLGLGAATDGLLLAANVLSHPQEISGYLVTLKGLPRFDRTVVPMGKGLSVAYGED